VRLGHQQHSNEPAVVDRREKNTQQEKRGETEIRRLTGERRKKTSGAARRKARPPMASHESMATHNLEVMKFTIAACTSPKTTTV
jgi:hypothetical protein